MFQQTGSKARQESGTILAACVVDWVPVSPNRTRGDHWSKAHRHRKRATLAWQEATMPGTPAGEVVAKARKLFSS